MIPLVKLSSDNKLERENCFILMIGLFTEQKVLQLKKGRELLKESVRKHINSIFCSPATA